MSARDVALICVLCRLPSSVMQRDRLTIWHSSAARMLGFGHYDLCWECWDGIGDQLKAIRIYWPPVGAQ